MLIHRIVFFLLALVCVFVVPCLNTCTIILHLCNVAKNLHKKCQCCSFIFNDALRGLRESTMLIHRIVFFLLALVCVFVVPCLNTCTIILHLCNVVHSAVYCCILLISMYLFIFFHIFLIKFCSNVFVWGSIEVIIYTPGHHGRK